MESLAALTAWESFYVIVGSSGAALTGLQFVVIALVSDSNMLSGDQELAAFATPTIVHFCAVLLVASIMSAPWHTLGSPATVLSVCGACGVLYTALVTYRASRQSGYHPVLEDWIWYIVLPLVGYASLFVAGVIFSSHLVSALFTVAAVSLLLLFIGIHNAWDTVVWVATQAARRRAKKDQQA